MFSIPYCCVCYQEEILIGKNINALSVFTFYILLKYEQKDTNGIKVYIFLTQQFSLGPFLFLINPRFICFCLH